MSGSFEAATTVAGGGATFRGGVAARGREAWFEGDVGARLRGADGVAAADAGFAVVERGALADCVALLAARDVGFFAVAGVFRAPAGIGFATGLAVDALVAARFAGAVVRLPDDAADRVDFAAAVLRGTLFFAATDFFATDFFAAAAGRFAAGFLATVFFATAFFATVFLVAAFFAAAFFAGAFFAAAFFAAGRFAAAAVAVRLRTAGLDVRTGFVAMNGLLQWADGRVSRTRGVRPNTLTG